MNISYKEKLVKSCPVCNESFKPHCKSTKFCSIKCFNITRSIRETKICKICKKQFKTYSNTVFHCKSCVPTKSLKNCFFCEKEFKALKETSKFCSRQCYYNNNNGLRYKNNLFQATNSLIW